MSKREVYICHFRTKEQAEDYRNGYNFSPEFRKTTVVSYNPETKHWDICKREDKIRA